MTDSMFSDKSFLHLKSYAAFLLNNKLEEATALNISLAREVNLPLLKLLSHLNEAQLNEFVKQALQTQLEQFTTGNAVEGGKATLLKWRSDTLPNIPKNGVATEDLVLTYHVRKGVYLKLLHHYTNNPETILNIVQEFDSFFSELVQYAVGLYVSMKEEEHEAFNLLLQDEQIKLEEAYEELIASQEELQEVNEQLREEVSKREATEKALTEANNSLESKVAERTSELLSREQQMRLMTDALPVLITYVDSEERYRFNNLAYEEWFKRPRSEVYGKKLVEVVGEQAYASLKDTVKRVLGGETIHLESKVNYKELGEKWISVHYIPHKQDKKVVGYYALISDVSDHKRAQERLEKANQELLKINTDLDNFIYTASHDLRSPIINLEGLLMALKKQLDSPTPINIRQLIVMMDVSVAKLNKTIRDLTEITKAQKGLEEKEEAISVRELIDEIRADLESNMPQVKPIICENLQLQSLTFARRSLRSILYNLLTNAFKYRSADRQLNINIESYQEGEFAVLSIQDNGLGLDEQQLPKLFTMFKRLHTHVEGTGIGLYIVKRIVENGGGKIEVESQRDKGSTFKVFLRQ